MKRLFVVIWVLCACALGSTSVCYADDIQRGVSPAGESSYQYMPWQIGDTVIIKKDVQRYLTGEIMSRWVYYVQHTIRQIGTRRFPDGVLLRGIYSWVGKDDIELLSRSRREVNERTKNISSLSNAESSELEAYARKTGTEVLREQEEERVHESIDKIYSSDSLRLDSLHLDSLQVATQEPVERPAASFYLKTNLLYDLATVANLGLEIGFKDHYSIDLPVNFSPWTTHPKYRLRVFSVQPEFRYWFGQEHKGHYLGVHGIVGLYNVSFGDSHRYQTHMIDDKLFFPALGVGLSYGYSLWLDKKREHPNWFMEFNIGVGYVYERYDSYYNLENGAMFSSGDEHHYFGPTKLEIAIGCRLGDVKKKNK